MLLVNKFRNKFNVITTTELDIDRHIVQEVQKMLDGGQTQQLALQKLDQQLAADIKKLRASPKAVEKVASAVASKPSERLENPDEIPVMGRISHVPEDAKSGRSYVSNARSQGMRSQTVGIPPNTYKTVNPFNEK